MSNTSLELDSFNLSDLSASGNRSVGDRSAEDRSFGDRSVEDGLDLDDFLQRYSCTLQPDVRLKFNKRVKALKLGAHLTVRNPTLNSSPEHSWAFTIRPALEDQSLRSKILNKVTVEPGLSQITWTGAKLHLFNFFRIRMGAGYNWRRKAAELDWRVTTKWNQDTHNSTMKHKLPIGSRASVVPHFHANFDLPSMGGGIGGAREAAELDTGYCHLSMPKVDLVLSLDRRPQPALVPFWMHRSLPSFRKKQRGEEASQQQVGAALGPKSPAAQQPGVRNTFICVKVYPGMSAGPPVGEPRPKRKGCIFCDPTSLELPGALGSL